MPRRMRTVGLLLALTACVAEKDRGFIEVSGYTAEPGATVTVWSAGGDDQGAITNEDGSYVVHGILPPYDILYASKSWRSLVLGSSAPFHNFPGPGTSASISDRSFVHVSVTGRDVESTYAFWGIDCGRAEQTSSPISVFSDFFPSFYVEEPTSCSAEALAFSRNGDGYSGYGSTPVEILPAEEGFFTVEASEPIPSHLVHFNVSNENATTTRAGTGLVWAFGQRTTAVAGLHDGDLTLVDLAVPEKPDLHVAAFFGSAGSDSTTAGFAYAYRALDAAQADFDVVVPNAEIMLAPATDNTHIASDSDLSVAALDGVVYLLHFDIGDVLSTRPTISLTELDDRGMSFEQGVRQHIQVDVSTGSSVDSDTSENALARLPAAVRIHGPSRSFFVD